MDVVEWTRKVRDLFVKKAHVSYEAALELARVHANEQIERGVGLDASKWEDPEDVVCGAINAANNAGGSI